MPLSHTTDPIENPALVAAIADFSREPSDLHREALTRELARATYLVPILEDEVSLAPGAAPGEQVIEPGSRFATLICKDPQTGEELLPIFSDWEEVTAFTDLKVATLVLELAEVRSLLAGDAGYAGAVVNPGGTAIPLPNRLLARLSEGAEDA